MCIFPLTSIPLYSGQHHRFLAALAYDFVAILARLSLYSTRGNRRGNIQRYVNLLITMVLGGLWHGAGWTFVLRGALHGFYLVLNVARSPCWPSCRGGIENRRVSHAVRCDHIYRGDRGLGFFRAPSLDVAVNILQGMVGLNGISFPEAMFNEWPTVKRMWSDLGAGFYLGGGSQFVAMYAWLLGLGLIVFLAPNTQQWCASMRYERELATETSNSYPRLVSRWYPGLRWSILLGIAFTASFLSLTRVSEFLYFQF